MMNDSSVGSYFRACAAHTFAATHLGIVASRELYMTVADIMKIGGYLVYHIFRSTDMNQTAAIGHESPDEVFGRCAELIIVIKQSQRSVWKFKQIELELQDGRREISFVNIQFSFVVP